MVEQNGAIKFGHATPVLRVSEMAKSLAYYQQALGFEVAFRVPNNEHAYFAGIFRGEASLFLSVGDQGHFGSWVWIDGKDVTALYAELVEKGAVIRNPPTNYSWALEIQVEDPDGNILRFGSDPIPGQSQGAWLAG
jgi:uncharacterized glyoxalase superfamily protein PhnB